MNRASNWAVAFCVSVLFHAILFSFLTVAVDPEPVSEQDVPNSQLELQTYAVERTTAHQDQPKAETADAARTAGTGVAQSNIPVSHSQPIALASAAITASENNAEQVGLARHDTRLTSPVTPETTKSAVRVASGPRVEPTLTTTTVNAPEKPNVERIAGTLTGADTMQADSINAQPIVEIVNSVPTSARLTLAAARLDASQPSPKTQPILDIGQQAHPAFVPSDQSLFLTPSNGNAEIRPDIPPPRQAAPLGHSDAAELAALTPTATKAKAALAFSGSDKGDVDPVSFAAIQSFMQAGELRSSNSDAGTVRDGIAATLEQVPCSRLQVQFVPETGTLQVNGHVPETGLRAPVLAALRTQVGEDIGLADNLLILPRPQCGALAGIAAVGLAQSTDQITNAKLVGENTHVREFKYAAGERLILDMAAPDYDAYLYVDYFDAEGQVIHLTPNEVVSLRSYAANSTLQIGKDDPEIPSLKIFIGPPFGQEIGVAFAASVPLYQETRPISEPAEPYLDWLKGRVDQTRLEEPDFKGEWVYFFITTRPG